MGWKLAALVTPDAEESLDAVVAQVYGEGHRTGTQALPLAAALPLNDAPRAVTMAGHHWIFDWSRIEGWLIDAPSDDRTWYAFTLLDTTRLYGFSMFRQGTGMRRRIGSADKGLSFDDGPILPKERAALIAACNGDLDPERLAAWQGTRVSAHVGVDEEQISHEQFGEAVVLGLAERLTGVDWDALGGILAQSVLTPGHVEAPEKQGLFKRIMGSRK